MKYNKKKVMKVADELLYALEESMKGNQEPADVIFKERDEIYIKHKLK